MYNTKIHLEGSYLPHISAGGPYRSERDYKVDRFPDTCPVCKRGGTHDLVYAWLPNQQYADLQAVFRCPLERCQSLFIASYRISVWPAEQGTAILKGSHVPRYVEPRTFSDNISAISPDFCTIFKEAVTAEAGGLRSICGVGYRKAIEILIKDFLIRHVFASDPEQQNMIRTTFLGPCINKHVANEWLRAAAERAVWLGNDETHYQRKWADRDLEDLKALIKITVSWVDLEMESDKYNHQMPGPR